MSTFQEHSWPLQRTATNTSFPMPEPVKCPDCGTWWRTLNHTCPFTSSEPVGSTKVSQSDTVTIRLRAGDADFMATDEWADERLQRIADACRAALEGER